MTSIITSIFSSRKAAMDDRDGVSSPLAPKSALSTRQNRRKSLPEKKARQSLKSLDNYSDSPPPTPSPSAKTNFTGKSPKASGKASGKASEKAPRKAFGKASGKAPAKSPSQLPTKAPEQPPYLLSPAKVSLDQNDAIHEPAEQHVADGPSAPTEAQFGGPVMSADEAEAEIKYTFDKFTDYRWVGNSIEIQVEWQDGDVTWEQEVVLHEDAPDALLAYWESQNGRPTNPQDPDLFDIYAIRKHSKDRKKLLVEWVGYGPEEASWVSRVVVEKTAPLVVAAYWRSIGDAGPGKRRGRRRKS
ncbi:hypothetical protein E4U21_006627 [Claviceps maximensis]|nr:hypothetical protein E4U21_006627 [Claviceps maximensis]